MAKNNFEPRLKLPKEVPNEGILVGWSLEHENKKQPIGFAYGDDKQTPKTGYLNPIVFESDGHLMTIAPTGAGKGTGCVIPTLLSYDGPVIVIDPKGENAAVTARQRREMGQKVIILDPMGITGLSSERLNPLDLLNIDNLGVVDDVAMLANTLLGAQFSAPRDKYWTSRGGQMIIGAMMYLMVEKPDEELTIAAVREFLGQPPETLLELAQKMSQSPDPDLRQAASIFAMTAPETMGGILSFAQEGLDFVRGQQVRTATSNSSFSLDEITRGEPVSIYIVIPPEKLESHARLLRLWVSVLISAITRRRGPPPKPTLFILDEAAQLGTMPQLRQAITLLRGYGLRTWSFWQDVSQLKLLYPQDWPTMVNNCKVLQAFGSANMAAARDVAEFTGFHSASTILDLDYDEMVLSLAGDEAVISQRPNYLQDPCYQGCFDDNPLHNPDADIMPKPARRQRHYRRPSADKQQQPDPETKTTADAIDGRSIPPSLLKKIRKKWDEK
ncbi:Coupling protein VirD4, ATPase required for T-DNA transfer [hydrothermal vent metagenome]|uniref:Coupling protein VirD4, ATPase required for T-DNA transfer n=1 Tax=hydrothermal vent metagenome TaxID=652676 RepID=A0A3B0RTT5_9ZZZZ